MGVIGRIPKDYRAYAAEACAMGWRTKVTKSGVVFLAPDGVHSEMLHFTPSDRRGPANFRAAIRRFSVCLAG